MSLSTQHARTHQPIHDIAQRSVRQWESTPAAMGARSRRLGGSQVSDQAIDAHVGPERLTSMESSERVEQAPLGEVPVCGFNRSVGHGRRCSQPAVGVGSAPSTAIRIAWASSSES